MNRIREWLSQYNWGSLIGSVMFFYAVAFIVCPVVAGLGTHQKPPAAYEYNQGQNESPDVSAAEGANDRVAQYTLWLTIFTALLVAVSGWQGYLIMSAEAGTREALRISSAQADAAKENARNLLRATRPFIVIKSAWIGTFQGSVPAEEVPEGFAYHSVFANFENRGTASGFINDINAATGRGNLGPPLSGDSNDPTAGGFATVKAGEAYNSGVPIGSIALPGEGVGNHILSPYVYGWVRYTDIHGISRRSGFAFRFFSLFNLGGGGAAGLTSFAEGDSRYWYDTEEEA